MGLTLKEWSDEAAELEDSQALAVIEALDTLLEWPKFKQEYGWTGLNTVRVIVMHEMDVRHPAP